MRRFLPLALVLLSLFSPAFGQSTDAALGKRLLNRQFLLRGCWQGANLWFTADGRPLNDYPELPFTLSGVKIDHLKLQKNGLDLEAHRMGLQVDAKHHGAVRWVPIALADTPNDRTGAESLHLHISPPPSGDYTSSLDAIFADSVNDLAPLLPAYWRSAAKQFFGLDNQLIPSAQWLHGPDLKSYASLGSFTGQGRPQPSTGNTVQPALLSGVNPDFTPAARRLKYASVVVLQFTVNPDGTVANPQIIQPAGLGLDEAAIAAVLQYRFSPGTVDGKPQSMQIGTAVRFEIR
ncbi:energy transducer TonB [Terriglobus tenax]|uniref:energy transducer TonB n=1 Tax=Terriglobus tenax TaxID=1111115 RepID=UPI0021E0B416|nr:energy transducer TonB [Terriglobus tenax]